MPSYTYRDGELVEIPDTVITVSDEIREPVKNTLIIRAGAHVTSWAKISGTVVVEQDAVLETHAAVGGTVDIQAGGRALFRGKVGGTIQVREGGAATLADTAVALGTMKVDGVLTNEGVRGVQVNGHGRVIDAPGSTVRQPDATWPDGTVVYHG